MPEQKKPFFTEATKAEIKRKNLVVLKGFLGILSLKPDDYVIIPPLVPEEDYESARKFMKHGKEVRLTRFYSLEQAVKYNKTPVQLRRSSFNNISNHNYCGYTFLPLGRDRRKRKVSLIECLEGARLFAYFHQNPEEHAKVKAYADAKRVKKEGAEVVVEMPSRREGQSNTQLKLISVPYIKSSERYGISLNIGSDHSCPSKRFNIRYRHSDDKEASGIVNICAHEIAAYLSLIEQEWNDNKNDTPLEMCPFAIPSQKTVDYYLKWENNILVHDTNLTSKNQLRKPNRAEKEIGLWALVQGLGHDKTFYSKKSRDGNVQDYNWKV